VRIITRPLEFLYYCLFKRDNFCFRNKIYRYHYSLWNVTFRNERAIEIPIILDIIKDYKGYDVLEVGNVMHWYYRFPHDVVDKYEKCCINEDIETYNPHKKYDLIFSISTLEHVGYDEPEERDLDKIYRAVQNMKCLLKQGGLLVVTIPVGHRDIDYNKLGMKFYYKKWSRGHEIAVGYYHLQERVFRF
jgi:hypothetical protein